MIPLVGYADRLSVRPEEAISFHVSYHPKAEPTDIQTSIVRVINADPHGDGIQTEAVKDAVMDCVQAPGPWMTQLGSHAEIQPPKDIRQSLASSGFAFSINILPTLLRCKNRQTAACIPGIFELSLGTDGKLTATFGEENKAIITLEKPLKVNYWVNVLCQVGSDEALLALKSKEGSTTIDTTAIELSNFESGVGETLYLACRGQDKTRDQHFNGRLENPQLWASSQIKPTRNQFLPSIAPTASWDFSLKIPSQTIQDTGPHKLHGKLINAPTRGVRGSNWTGQEMCWRHAPNEYSAIHFHSTDFGDCQWPASYQWKIPNNLRSGNYALLLTAGEGEADNIPFFVVPPKGTKKAEVAVLISTFTYIIYGNHARGEWIDDPYWESAWKEQVQQIPASYPYNPREHPEYGWSTYNTHADCSGISLLSWRRPLLNLKIGYITFPYPEWAGSGLRHYPADTHLTTWLETQGIAYDVATDWELHTEGSQVLKPYRVVMTGSHPEYHSEASLNAMREYKDEGGRFMCLGGNSFYWKIAVDEKHSLLEIRRGEGGIRAWASDAGEYHHQLDGKYGGLWRRNGRAPQELGGVGFSSQGHFVGSYYRIREGARKNARVAWMLEGLENVGTIGKHGLSGHGAAGFELDRADVKLGTPGHAIIVASSEEHDQEKDGFLLVFEERLSHHGNLAGVPDADLIRADIVFFETPSGGAVFSTGSITYCGSLLTHNCQNDISTLTKNVLMKFLDPNAVFSVPD